MYNEYLNGQIKIKEMTPFQFYELIREWKLQLFRIGHTDRHDFVKGVLIKHLDDVENEYEFNIVTDYLRSEYKWTY